MDRNEKKPGQNQGHNQNQGQRQGQQGANKPQIKPVDQQHGKKPLDEGKKRS